MHHKRLLLLDAAPFCEGSQASKKQQKPQTSKVVAQQQMSMRQLCCSEGAKQSDDDHTSVLKCEQLSMNHPEKENPNLHRHKVCTSGTLKIIK
jgi:hypothetical protein